MSLTIVLDTNVCLDLFVFHDPRWARLMQGLQDQTLIAKTRQDCRDEWLAVLHYRHLPVSDINRNEIAAHFDRYITLVTPENSSIVLPVCKDQDDQKFLELSRDANVDVLITKDKELLKLTRKIQKLNLFHIQSPGQFLDHLVANPQAS